MSGIDAIITIRAQFPEARIIVVTILPRRCSTRAPQAGVHGYVLKGLLRRELLERIRAVHAEEERIPEVAAQITEGFESPP